MPIDFRDLSKERFEELCKRLLIEEDPKIKTIDGSGGDEGIECFKGEFNKELEGWQVKYFLGRLTPSRKTQINRSLKRARERHILRKWVLCLPLEFSPSEEVWFENLKKEEENKNIEISHMNVHVIKNLLQKHRPIRDEFFKGEEKKQLDRMERVLEKIKEEGTVEDLIENHAYLNQLSAFKIKIVGLNISSVIQYLKAGIPFRAGLGFKKFQKVTEGNYMNYFHMPTGKSTLKLNVEDDNPFKVTVPFSNPIETWIKDSSSKISSISEVDLLFFTSNYDCKNLLLKLIKENIPEPTIIKEIDFNKTIKSMISQKSKFLLTTTTVKLDPYIIEKVEGETGKKDHDVEIRSNIIHAKNGGLPNTEFMKSALSYVKNINKDGKISDIIFFRAKQTDKIIPEKILTVEVHNDGRIRIWYKKSNFKDKTLLKIALESFIDKNY